MEIERTDKPKKDDSLYFSDLNFGETFICVFAQCDPIVYMKCFGTRYGNEYNAIRLCDGHLSNAKGDLLVKKVNGKFVYSLEEGDD